MKKSNHGRSRAKAVYERETVYMYSGTAAMLLQAAGCTVPYRKTVGFAQRETFYMCSSTAAMLLQSAGCTVPYLKPVGFAQGYVRTFDSFSQGWSRAR